MKIVNPYNRTHARGTKMTVLERHRSHRVIYHFNVYDFHKLFEN